MIRRSDGWLLFCTRCSCYAHHHGHHQRMYCNVTSTNDAAYQKLEQHDYPLCNRRMPTREAKTSIGPFEKRKGLL